MYQRCVNIFTRRSSCNSLLQLDDLVMAEVAAGYTVYLVGDIAELRLVLRPHPSVRLQAPPH